MRYTLNEPICPAAVADLREAVGWNRMEKSLRDPRMTCLAEIGCYDHDVLVGYVAACGNGVTDAYIQDLMVRPDFQRRGLGTELMRRMLERLRADGIYMISVIYGEESLRPFYEKFGFYTMLCGQMETRREP